MMSIFLDWVARTFHTNSFIKLADMSCSIDIAYSIKFESGPDSSRIVNSKALQIPLLTPYDSFAIEKMEGFSVVSHMGTLKTNSIIFNPEDLSSFTIFIGDDKDNVYLDSGLGVIEPENENTAFFLAWYMKWRHFCRQETVMSVLGLLHFLSRQM